SHCPHLSHLRDLEPGSRRPLVGEASGGVYRPPHPHRERRGGCSCVDTGSRPVECTAGDGGVRRIRIERGELSKMAAIPIRAAQKNWLDRSLSLFTDVQAGEGATALLLAANIFCFFTLYSVLKPIRSALILSESGAVAQSYAAAGQAALLLGLVLLYGAFASRVNRMRLITWVTIFFAANLVVFWTLGLLGLRIGIAFYIWLGIFNLMVPAQLWAFANDIYSTERGKRLFPIVGLGASIGAWVGAEFASEVFRSFGPYRLMLLAAGGLVACLALTFWVNRRERSREVEAGQAEPVAEQPLGKEGGFQLVLAQRYLLYIALLFVV